MLTDRRKQEIIRAANQYSDIAIRDGTRKASKKFFNDYFEGKWSTEEHLILICLVQEYINCKFGAITRTECVIRQNEIFNEPE